MSDTDTQRAEFEALMPEPAHVVHTHSEAGDLHFYTAPQMLEAIQAATERERERAAKVVERVGPKEGALALVTSGFAAAIRETPK